MQFYMDAFSFERKISKSILSYGSQRTINSFSAIRRLKTSSKLGLKVVKVFV